MYGLDAHIWFGCPCMVWMPMYVHEMEGVPLQFEIIVQEKVGPKVTGTTGKYPFFHYDFVI